MSRQAQDVSGLLLSNLRRQRSMYTFGGGTIGGVWRWRQPTTIERMQGITEPIPELDPKYRGVGPAGQNQLTGRETTGPRNQKEVYVIPAGMSNKQEYAWMKKEAEQKGIPYVEAPERWTKKGKDDKSFYNAQGQKFSGTLMGTGSYGGFGSDEYQALGKMSKAAREGRRESRKMARQAEREAPQEVPQEKEPPTAPEGYVYNRYGNLEPEEWYTIDEETGERRKKTLREYRASRK
jgi:hypothetical protein